MENVNRKKFARPEVLEVVGHPTLSVDVVITCRNSQEKLDLALAALSLQDYPENLTHFHIIDDGSLPKLILPLIRPVNSTLYYYENEGNEWGKSKSTNFFVRKLKSDILWFLDSDMIVEPSHLSHHLKWHHNAVDYVVLGYKQFVEDWDYDPQSLLRSLKNNDFLKLHSEFIKDEWWNSIVDSSNQLRSDNLRNYAAFVGATFSISRQNWNSLDGYDEKFATGEDTEFGWRCFMNGLRFVPEQSARSWHLGLTTMQKNRNLIPFHNNPLMANYVPANKNLRQKGRLGGLYLKMSF